METRTRTGHADGPVSPEISGAKRQERRMDIKMTVKMGMMGMVKIKMR